MPRPHLKPLKDQTLVITGGSSGIGLATARRAARAGARVILVARNEEALVEAVEGIKASGGVAAHFAIDIAESGAAEAIGDYVKSYAGGFDTWVNDAAVALYARLEEVTMEEHRRVFDVGYFGLVEASLYAAKELKGRGGAIINVGSVLSERAVPVQGTYCAMKHAVRGFTDSLRMELEMENAGISVTLIKPNGIDTPYSQHARNKMGKPARIPPILYDPELVAKAICFAAEHPRRDLTVGGQGFLVSKVSNIFPRSADIGMELFMGENTQTIDTPPEPGSNDNLFEERKDGEERGNQDVFVRKSSLALEAQMNPLGAVAMIGGAAALTAFAFGDALFGRRRAQPVVEVEDRLDPAPYQDELRAGIADESAIPLPETVEALAVTEPRGPANA